MPNYSDLFYAFIDELVERVPEVEMTTRYCANVMTALQTGCLHCTLRPLRLDHHFREANKSRKALQLTMITTYGVKQNTHSGIVQSQVKMDDLFISPE